MARKRSTTKPPPTKVTVITDSIDMDMDNMETDSTDSNVGIDTRDMELEMDCSDVIVSSSPPTSVTEKGKDTVVIEGHDIIPPPPSFSSIVSQTLQEVSHTPSLPPVVEEEKEKEEEIIPAVPAPVPAPKKRVTINAPPAPTTTPPTQMVRVTTQPRRPRRKFMMFN